MTQTYYEVLGVDEDAEADEIREAYREKLHEYHPDVSDHPNAQERFLLVKEANQVLSDPEKRQKYDELGHETYVVQVQGRQPESDDTTEGRADESSATDDTDDTDDDAESDRDRSRSRDEGGREGSGRSAADEYRNKRRQTQARSRSDRSGRGRGSRSATGRDRGGSTAGGRRRTETESSESDTGSDAESASDTGSEESTADGSTTTRGFGQPAAGGMFVSPDIELLRFPGLVVYYFLAWEFGLSLLLAPLLVPLYLYYRRHKFTERLLTDDIVSTEAAADAARRLAIGSGIATVLTATLVGVTVGGITPASFTSPVVAALGAGVLAGLGVSLYSFAQLLLYDWVEQKVSQPVAWDVLSRTPVLVAPLIVVQQAAFPEPFLLTVGLLAVSAVSPLVYLAVNGDGIDVEVADTRSS